MFVEGGVIGSFGSWNNQNTKKKHISLSLWRKKAKWHHLLYLDCTWDKSWDNFIKLSFI